jgi:hypothetical protein
MLTDAPTMEEADPLRVVHEPLVGDPVPPDPTVMVKVWSNDD